MSKIIQVGTRGSKMALLQTQAVVDAVHALDLGYTLEPFIIQTTGDWKPEHGEKSLGSYGTGGNGVFVREIENALADGRVRCAVHSLKDMPSTPPEGFAVDHVLKREEPRDAFVSFKYNSLDDMPAGAVLGTSSLRRRAIILQKRQDLQLAPLRGNVPTRLEKMQQGQVDAAILGAAGLQRVGMTEQIKHYFDPAEMLPACGQGTVAIEIKSDDDELRTLFDKIHCATTGLCIAAERAVLRTLGGSCQTPMGAYASLANGQMALAALIADMDCSNVREAALTGAVNTRQEAEALGTKLAQQLLAQAPAKSACSC